MTSPALKKDLILVLEDYHLITFPDIHDSLNYLLEHLPTQLCVVVITSSDLPLNLARRRVRGELTEIRASDLRFTLDETTTFFNQSMQLRLTDSDIAKLSQRTEGWIAGLQMAVLPMQDEEDPHHFIAAFNGDDHFVADYLVEEVLQRQLTEAQRFLLKTSILDRMNASLCNAVTGRSDSHIMLNTLERANRFILRLQFPTTRSPLINALISSPAPTSSAHSHSNSFACSTISPIFIQWRFSTSA